MIPYTLAKELLDETDRFAVETVKAGKGGPFGASIHVYDPLSRKATLIGSIASNAVLDTGVASDHAESQAISPANVDALRDYLRKTSVAEPVVVISSSGQSCPACHSKEEILARTLLADGTVKPGNIVVNYGATFRDTAEIARFNDEPYILDMYRRASNPAAGGTIDLVTSAAAEVPESVQAAFRDATRPIAVVALGDKVLAIGRDRRDEDITATPEVDALRKACRDARAAEMAKNPESARFAPTWNLNRAVLYTASLDAGPLAYAESQWTNVSAIVTVRGHEGRFNPRPDEAPGINNREFFGVVALGYNREGSALRIMHVADFPNLAQKQWRKQLEERGDAMLYNGSDADPTLLALRPVADSLFRGEDARLVTGGINPWHPAGRATPLTP